MTYAVRVISKAKPEKSLKTMLANGVFGDFSLLSSLEATVIKVKRRVRK
jgi:hypothetical protein